MLTTTDQILNSDFSSSISSGFFDKAESMSDKNIFMLQKLWSGNSSSSKSNKEIDYIENKELEETMGDKEISKNLPLTNDISDISNIKSTIKNSAGISIKKSVKEKSKSDSKKPFLTTIKNKKYQFIEGINGETGLEHIMMTKYLYVDTSKGNVYIHIPFQDYQKNAAESKKIKLYQSWTIKDSTKSMVGKAHYHTYLLVKLAFENHGKRKQNYKIGMHNGECIKIRLIPNTENEKMFIIESQYIPDNRCCNKIKKYY